MPHRIIVANVRTYCGDMRRTYYIGHPSPFGNPFKITRDARLLAREEVIAQFRDYWYAVGQAALRAQAERDLTDVEVLLCWCAPLPCHGDVIAEYLNPRTRSPV